MKSLLLIGILGCFLSASAYSAQLPEPAKKDKRIRFATYDQFDVITIHSQIGIGTTIFFEPDEQVVDMVGGDVEAWGAEVPTRRNGVFLKPAALLPNANLQVITTKRSYTFELRLAQRDKQEAPFMTVFFRYPGADRIAQSKQQDAERIQALLAEGTKKGNQNYSVQGDSELAPIEVWDDGRSTFLRFRGRGNMPAIYSEIGATDPTEQVEAITVSNDLVQVHGVRRKLILRIERRVACVFNEDFRSSDQRPATNTASPHVIRTLKGETK